jgi:phospholipid/cholesterol/gamma-HCH transport system permease protein
MLPLLSVVATLAGLVGGLTVAVFSLGIPMDLYISRVQETATLSHYLTGLSKAPIFAMVIALVGCLEGLKVAGTAQSVGERTTSAVVQSISLVIIIDALAAVFFMEMGW